MQPLPSLPRVRTLLWILAGFFVLGLLTYGWSLGNEFVRWDDGMLIFENPAIRQITPASLWWIFTHFDPELYIPLTFLSYQIEYFIAGVHPFLYHLDSLILHTLNAALVSLLAFFLLRKKYLALFCGLLFLVHPLNTEAVEWASGRKDVLSTFFLLASIASYFVYRDRDNRRWYIASLVLFLCGLLSKVMIITLPVVLVVLDIAERRAFTKRMVLDKIPYLGLSIVFGLIGILGKESVLASSSLSDKILMAFKSTTFYIYQFLWPAKFSLLYPYKEDISITSPDFFVPIIIVLLLLGIVVWTFKRQRLIAAGIGFFFITVAPTLLNFAKGGEMDIYFASDRYAYVPQIGLILVLGTLIAWVLEKRPQFQKIIGGAGVVLVCILSILSYRQSLVWQNTRTLFQHVIRIYPDASHVAYNNLCNADRIVGNLELAIDECEKSVAIKPHPKTYANLGAAYRKQKNYTRALEAYEKGIALDPQSAYPHFGLGIVYAEQGRYDEAEIEYLKAIGLNPRYVDVYVNLGALYAAQAKYEQAIAQYQKAIALHEFHAAALFNLAVAEDESGKLDDAERDYKRAITADPTRTAPRINLGLLLHEIGDTDGAVAQFRAVLRIDPENAAARSALQQLGEL
ncbi:tetratricopeptide repeat protein [Candidatus Peribacteria bacterium]|nr:MAG: tetratricopeptide repeat protein [Candidatus Peribacteria bacterium]